MTKLYKLKVSKVFYKEYIVKAEDSDHALEIGSEIADFSMECNDETFFEDEWEVEEVLGDIEVTYEPIQEYLK